MSAIPTTAVEETATCPQRPRFPFLTHQPFIFDQDRVSQPLLLLGKAM